MADPEPVASQPRTAPDDMHWGINYLREDIQDLRAETRTEIRELRTEFREFRADTKAEFAAVRREMQEGDASLRAENPGSSQRRAASQIPLPRPAS